MFRNFHGRTANDVWTAIATDFQTMGNCEMRESRTGYIADLGNVCISIKDPRQRWVVSREPAINPAFALAEVVWILAGRNDSRFLNYFNHKLPCFAGDHCEYPGAYGFRLRNNLGFDQFERAFAALSNNQHTRQVVLQIWDGLKDFPDANGVPASTDVPCNVLSLLKLRNSKLDWTQVIRSNDFYLGLPHNLVQFTSLHEVIAGWLRVPCGEFHLVTDCLHVYERDLPVVRHCQFTHPELNNDQLALEKSASDRIFAVLAESVDLIIDETSSTSDLLSHLEMSELPISYRNILLVLLAEGVRRRKERNLANELMTGCTNPAFVQTWNRWVSRLARNAIQYEHEVFQAG